MPGGGGDGGEVGGVRPEWNARRSVALPAPPAGALTDMGVEPGPTGCDVERGMADGWAALGWVEAGVPPALGVLG